MTHTQFTTDDYLRAIKRELGKRETTYPNILKKMTEKGERQTKQEKMYTQNFLLNVVGVLIENNIPPDICIETPLARCLSELIRELKIRKSYYPRLIWMDRNRKSPRMTQETANYELAAWESLTRWFAKEYLDLDELPTKRRKKT